MVASAPIRSETAPAARRPIAEPMPYAVRASEATARLRPWSRTNGTAWTEIMNARPPCRSHEAFRYHWRGSASAWARVAPVSSPPGSGPLPGRAVQPARRDLSLPRRPHGQRGQHRERAAAAPDERIGRAPAEEVDEPGRQRPGGDIAEVEPDQDQGQGQPSPGVEPPRDRRRAQQVEARHADPAHEAHEEIELPERVDHGDEGEGGPGQDHRHHQDQAGAVAVGQRSRREARDAADQQIHRQRRRDGPPAPPEALGEDGQEDAVGRERSGHAVRDQEEGPDDEPAPAHGAPPP